MEKFKMNSNGIETLSPKECAMVKGGDTVITNYNGGNELFYAINAAGNCIKWIKHWITGDDLYVTTIHDDGTRDEPVPYN